MSSNEPEVARGLEPLLPEVEHLSFKIISERDVANRCRFDLLMDNRFLTSCQFQSNRAVSNPPGSCITSGGGLLSTVPSLSIVTTVALSDATRPGFAPQSLFKYPALYYYREYGELNLRRGVYAWVLLLLPVAICRWNGA
jgi:hypothetical protein